MKFFFLWVVLVISIIILPTFCLAQETKTGEKIFAVPLKLEGIGNILGAGLQYETKQGNEFIIGGGVAERGQKGYGVSAKIPLSQSVFFSGSLFSASDLKIPSTYTRGSEEADLFYSKTSLSGTILGAGYNFEISPKNQFNFTFSLGSVEQQFHGFLDENFQEIQTKGNLGNLNSTLINYGITYSFQQYPKKVLQERGWRLYSKIANSTQTTNTLYSGTTKTDYALDLHIPLFRSFYIVPRVFQSTVKVVQPKLSDVSSDFKENSDANVLEKHFNICDTTCDLETKLITNLSQHNKYGTATPLGGTDLIRSAPFFRYKGSKTEYSALEIRYPFYFGKVLLEPVVFVEQGRSYDPEVIGQDDSLIQASGVELKFHLSEDLVYKILYAHSEQHQALQLNVDSSW